ncbi:cytochrome P450 [Triangularia setosa]|uniref:Cytochrome P450 n=1 Tax=Triangularia setosa TaxID=2587417 RepID=A0AAN6W048_9PEZI|nr:cytochrome P450 [Podospora setosa]
MSYFVLAHTTQSTGSFLTACLLVFYISITVLYRLYWHPLAKIPGQKLACASGLVEFYHDIVLRGNYVKAFPSLHAKYGPVIRIAPDKVHIRDTEFWHEVHCSGTKWHKDPAHYSSIGGVGRSLATEVEVELHRQKRLLVRRFFSAQYITSIEPAVLSIVHRAMNKAAKSHAEGSPFNISALFSRITADSITQVLFGKTKEKMCGGEDAGEVIVSTLDLFSRSFLLTKHFPRLAGMLLNLPKRVASYLLPGYIGFRRQVETWIDEVEAQHRDGKLGGDKGSLSLLDLLIQPELGRDDNHLDVEIGLAPENKRALVDEVLAYYIAGTHSSSVTMSLAIYYLLSNPTKLQKLQYELDGLPSNQDGLLEFKSLSNHKAPYFNAILKETLRKASPVPGPLPRIVPVGGVNCYGYYLPAGVRVSTSIRLVHDDPSIFPEPQQFLPERWLDAGVHMLERHQVAFSKGTRVCIGMNLAWMEMALCLANFVRRFDMSLYKTDECTTAWRDCAIMVLDKPVQVSVEKIRCSFGSARTVHCIHDTLVLRRPN